MANPKQAVKTASYVAGFLAIIASLTAMVLLIACAVGLFYPRKQKLILHSDSMEKIYDAQSVSCTDPIITYGKLHSGHKMVTVKREKYTKVGTYSNQVTYMIVDESGEDVSKQYAIEHDFGEIVIRGMPITISSHSHSKIYNGTALTSTPFVVSYGKLLADHQLETTSVTTITEPGEVMVAPHYAIRNKAGIDVTDQYEISEDLGYLTVKPIQIHVQTDDATKSYDGTALSNPKWSAAYAPLLEGHTLSLKGFCEISDIGEHPNTAIPVITDVNGKDVTRLYEVVFSYGTLRISPIRLNITTGSITKEYDGSDISCEQYTIERGALLNGDRIVITNSTKINNVGFITNLLTFQILNSGNADVTERYQIVCQEGRLEVTPRSITIRTDSASKKYDGKPLSCDTYTIIKGALNADERLELAFASLTNIGYAPNYVIDCTIRKNIGNGTWKDVTSNFIITYDYGTLTVTGS